MEALREAFRSGDYAEAERLARSMTLSRPHHAFGWKRLGVALLLSGKVQDALPPTQKSLELSPGDSETHNNLGVMLDTLGRKREAAEAFRRAIALDPCYAEACNNLGNVLIACGELIEAEACYRKAIALKSGYVEARNNLGTVLSMLGRHAEAMDFFRRAIALAPNYAEAHANLGNTLRELNQHAGAEECLLQAIALNPDHAAAHNSLGVVHYELGRIKSAEDCYRKAIALKPDYAQCHYNLSMVRTCTHDDPLFHSLHKLHDTVQNAPDKTYMCFALAKACEDLMLYDEAFHLYEESNALRKQALGYCIDQDRKLFDSILSAFDKLPEAHPLPARGTMPILIVGMPRSGTTLVEQILASHSEVAGAGELDTLSRLSQQHFIDAPHTDTAEPSRIISSDYLDELASMQTGFRFITDKMPLNFRWLGFLLSSLPGIRIVHVTRDPMAVCFSNFRQFFPATGMAFSCNLADLAAYHGLYENLMRFWKQKFPGRIHELNYERLTENQEDETRKLLAYCGLEWQERCMEFEKSERAVRTASAAQVRKKLYRGSSEAWRNYEKHLAPLLHGLGLDG